jgi:iron complex transport system ATP-binding protein
MACSHHNRPHRRKRAEPRGSMAGCSRPCQTMSASAERLPPSTPYFELRNAEAWLGGQMIFQDLSLSLFLGEHTVVLGPNGSGKSSLIRLLTREIYPVVRRGSWLRLFGTDTINLWRLRQRLGVLSQDLPNTYRGDVRAIDVVISGLFGSVGLGRSQQAGPEHGQKARALLERMGLAELADRHLQSLSEGQRRRLLLARALVHGPEVLVLDEPTNGLDLQARHQLLDLLSQLARGGTTLLLVSHRIEEIPPEISRAVLLKGGKVVADGSTGTLLSDQPLSALFDTPLKVLCHGGFRQVLPAKGNE